MTLPISGEYPDNWPEIAHRVKEEAGWRCVRCDHGHDPAAGRMLTVHHFDGDKGNCEPYNLMPLCQACHLSVQARVDPRVTLIFDPSTWAMPYIAGWYEADRGIPGPQYNLQRWIDRYIDERGRDAWPYWAPRPQQ